MTIQEMYQELEEQTKENNNSLEYDLYDDCYIVEIDYTTQEQYSQYYMCQFDQWHSIGRNGADPVPIMTSVQFTSMNIDDSIIFALNVLGDCNEMLHDFWVSELYDENDDPIPAMWNDNILSQIEKDVMYQVSL